MFPPLPKEHRPDGFEIRPASCSPTLSSKPLAEIAENAEIAQHTPATKNDRREYRKYRKPLRQAAGRNFCQRSQAVGMAARQCRRRAETWRKPAETGGTPQPAKIL
jgi:hypothetical protein